MLGNGFKEKLIAVPRRPETPEVVPQMLQIYKNKKRKRNRLPNFSISILDLMNWKVIIKSQS